jgi:hypothetical protein
MDMGKTTAICNIRAAIKVMKAMMTTMITLRRVRTRLRELPDRQTAGQAALPGSCSLPSPRPPFSLAAR